VQALGLTGSPNSKQNWNYTETQASQHAWTLLKISVMFCRYSECSEVWTQTTDYFQVVGIILGQLTVGFLGDWLGRRWGMIQVWVI